MSNEADTCREYILPKLRAAGWDAEPRQIAEQVFFDRYGPQARAMLNDLLDKYAAHGTAQFSISDALKVPPISQRGNISEIIGFFGGAEKLREAVNNLQSLLYTIN